MIRPPRSGRAAGQGHCKGECSHRHLAKTRPSRAIDPKTRVAHTTTVPPDVVIVVICELVIELGPCGIPLIPRRNMIDSRLGKIAFGPLVSSARRLSSWPCCGGSITTGGRGDYAGCGGIAGAQLKSFIERIERLEEESVHR